MVVRSREPPPESWKVVPLWLNRLGERSLLDRGERPKVDAGGAKHPGEGGKAEEDRRVRER